MSVSIATAAVPEPSRAAEGGASVVSLASGRPLDPAVAERRREDHELVRAILAGDAGAFDRLHVLYASRIQRFALKRLGDPTEAEDVVQDVFLEVHRCLDRWEGRSALLTWMFGIAHHQICRRFRKKTPISVDLDQLDAAPPVADDAPSEARVDAHRALEVCADVLAEEVAPAHRQIFDLYYGESRATRAIAEEVGKSNQAVKISLFRTRRAMEARLDAEGIGLSA